MTNLEILHFEQLKRDVQAKYLENHVPSHQDISKWKGIDIVYFQEELLKKVKGSISEKTFYTYFKTSPVSKLPRIDMLNLLANYIGYDSWFEYKKLHPIDVPQQSQEPQTTTEDSNNQGSKDELTSKISDSNVISSEKTLDLTSDQDEFPKISVESSGIEGQKSVNLPLEIVNSDQNIVLEKKEEKSNLQIKTTDNQEIEIKNNYTSHNIPSRNFSFSVKKYLWLIISALLSLTVLFLVFRDNWMSKEYQYSFIDADRNTRIKDELDVKIVKKDESPILFRVKPNESFIYTTKSKDLTMIVSSPFYRTDTIRRNLENAQESENIELKPNDYAIQLFYYSKSITDFKKKRDQLNNLISDNAIITQVFDNDIYGVETLDKQKYISLVTLPTTSLENLNVIDTQMKNGKIVMIKFKITSDEKTK